MLYIKKKKYFLYFLCTYISVWKLKQCDCFLPGFPNASE